MINFRNTLSALCIFIATLSASAADPAPAAHDPALKPLADEKYDGSRFSDVDDNLMDATGCPIRVDWDGIKESGIAPDTPITGEFKKMSTVAILNQILAKAAGKHTKPVAADVEGIVYVAMPDWIKEFKARLSAHATADKPTEENGSKIASLLDQDQPWLRFKSRPLEMALTVMSDQLDVSEIEVDWDSLGKFGVTKETPVDMLVPSARTAVSLTLLLMKVQPAKVRLDYKLVDDKIRVTAEAAK